MNDRRKLERRIMKNFSRRKRNIDRSIKRQKRMKARLNTLRSVSIFEQAVLQALHSMPMIILILLVSVCGILCIMLGLFIRSIEPTTDLIALICMIIVVVFNVLKLLSDGVIHLTGRMIERLVDQTSNIIRHSEIKED